MLLWARATVGCDARPPPPPQRPCPGAAPRLLTPHPPPPGTDAQLTRLVCLAFLVLLPFAAHQTLEWKVVPL